MEINKKKQSRKQMQNFKENFENDNKENFNSENNYLNNLNNNFKKTQIRSLKTQVPNDRYFGDQAEKIAFIKKEFEKTDDNPQKKLNKTNFHNTNKDLISLDTEEQEKKLAKKIDNENIIKIHQNYSQEIMHEKLNGIPPTIAALDGEKINNKNQIKRGKKNAAQIKEKIEKKIFTEDVPSEKLDLKVDKVKCTNENSKNKVNNKINNDLILIPNQNEYENLNNSLIENAQYKNLLPNQEKNNYRNKKNIINKNNAEKAQKKKLTTINDYLEKENVIIIRNYGTEIYNYMRAIENVGIPKDFLERHKINPDIRTKMVDWMIEVLSVYKCEQETFFLSVYIMDSYISRSPQLILTEDIHIIGLTSMFIASKFEDVIPIRMSSLVSKIGHDLFKRKQITLLEKKILEIVEFDKLITSSIYEFIRTFFYDFKFNNRKYIIHLKMEEEIKELEKCSILFAKLMSYSAIFYGYDYSLKAITCIISSFDTLRSMGKFINNESESFFREWILFLIEESSYTSEHINEVYNLIMKYHAEYDKIPLISYNLNKFQI